jgi:hypothetical protein
MSNNYLQFNGTNQYITVPDNDVLDVGDGDFSIAFWAKDIFDGSNNFILAKLGYKVQHFNGAIYLNTTFLIGSSTAWFVLPNDTEGWQHIVVTRSGSTVTAFLNGSSIDVSGSADNRVLSAFGDLNIGLSGGNYLTGSLDDIRLYKGLVLSQSEVSAIYNSGYGVKLDGTEDGLSWGSNCDTGTGDTLSDITGTVNGTLTGNSGDNMWEPGGVSFISDINASTLNLGGMKLSVSSDAPEFSSVNILNASYVGSSLITTQSSYTSEFNWGGVPLSITLFDDPVTSETDNIGHFYALDVIENTEEADSTLTFGPNALQVSKINNNYYLDTLRLGIAVTPENSVVLKGIPMSSGGYNELILNKTDYTMDDIDIPDPSEETSNIVEFMVDGVPLSAGRINNKYYLIVHPTALPE